MNGSLKSLIWCTTLIQSKHKFLIQRYFIAKLCVFLKPNCASNTERLPRETHNNLLWQHTKRTSWNLQDGAGRAETQIQRRESWKRSLDCQRRERTLWADSKELIVDRFRSECCPSYIGVVKIHWKCLTTVVYVFLIFQLEMLYSTHDKKSTVVCALWVHWSFIRDMSNNVSKEEIHSIKLYMLGKKLKKNKSGYKSRTKGTNERNTKWFRWHINQQERVFHK